MSNAERAAAASPDREPLAARPAAARDALRAAPDVVREYLRSILRDLEAPDVAAPGITAARLPELVFAAQTQREFCYLGRARVAPYRDRAQQLIARSVGRGEPVHYCLDIGGGYHASLRPGTEELSFGPGLGELLLLRQIRRFDTRVRGLYPPGTRFSLVIDNLVAWFVNDIAILSTENFCARLRDLIAHAGMAGLVELWVESEHLAAADFEELRPACRVAPDADALTGKDHDTIERFLGRHCDRAEAAQRAARYREITAVSGELINRRLDGLRMTQRATAETICFRPFPGADSRIQSGEVALCTATDGHLRPLLLTSHNQHLYNWYRIDFSDMLPAAIEQVICADPSVRPSI